MNESLDTLEKRLPDYFKALSLPWHIAADCMGQFVDDDQQPLGYPTHHARSLFHIAAALLSARAAEREARRNDVASLEAKLAEVTKSRDEERIEAWGYEIEVGDLKAKLSAQAKAIEAAREAFHLEDEKVTKARDFILNMKCSCMGEGIGTPGGCDRCRALDYLSTFGWDFNAALVPAPAATEKGEGA